ncbi:MAG: hypothetical protein PUC94_07930 [Bacteroidales bacterium]|nr:hypothetical protein [Bacteroidales bacterium]
MGAIGAVFEECSFSAGYESGKPMTSDSASFSLPLSFRSSPLALCFADSYCSRQKDAAENVNKLIRQYIPQKSNFNNIPDQYVKNVAKKLNLRPRKNSVFLTQRPSF